MTPLSLNIVSNEKLIREEYLLRFKLEWARSIRQMRGLGIVSGLLLFTGFIINQDEAGFNAFYFVGSVFGCTCLINLNMWINSKKNLQKLIGERIRKMPYNTTYIFDDGGMKFRDDDRYAELSWKLFTGLLTYGDFLILQVGDSFNSATMFHRSEMSKEEFSALETILKKKVQQKILN